MPTLKNNLLKIVTLSLFVTTILSCASSNPEKDNKPLNIILIMADDLGYETIGSNGGSSYKTPQLDKMAKQGMRFEHCYSQPLCTPSRVKLMTGISNIRNYVRFGLLEESQTTFGHLFQNAGYETCIIGKWQLGKDAMSPKNAGFKNHCLWQVTKGRADSTGRDTRYSMPVLDIDGLVKTHNQNDYGPDIVSDYGLDFIEKSHADNKPFLLYYPMILTHCPFSPTPDSESWSDDTETVMTYKGQPRYFGDMVSKMDQIVGKINQKLEELNIKDNTLIIFTGDNGTDKPIVSYMNGRKVAGAKGQSTDAGTRVPLIIQWPGVIKPNSINKELIDFSDFLPTISQAAKIIVPSSLDIDGQSFLEQLKGDNTSSREWIYNWYSRNGETEKARVFARTQQYKLYDTGEFYNVPNDFDETSPLNINELDPKTKKTYQSLSNVINQYKGKRLDKVKSDYTLKK